MRRLCLSSLQGQVVIAGMLAEMKPISCCGITSGLFGVLKVVNIIRITGRSSGLHCTDLIVSQICTCFSVNILNEKNNIRRELIYYQKLYIIMATFQHNHCADDSFLERETGSKD